MVLILMLTVFGCRTKQKSSDQSADDVKFASAMVRFTPYKDNPVFQGTGTNTWDRHIRERGYILVEDDVFKMWYTGYTEDAEPKYLGYATSDDGINWSRYSDEPIFNERWTEDMFVFKEEGMYYMYAEGTHDIAHLLTSTDGINWNDHGDLVIMDTEGEPIPPPYGTPAVWIEDGKWYLFYERNDLGIWLATSEDKKTWTNVQDDPVIKMGPEPYDVAAVAANQVVRHEGLYYLYYHGSSNPDWADPDTHALWTSNVAVSTDLVNWKKYPENPIVEGDHSSPILIYDGERNRLYTMHDKVWLYFSE